MQSWYHDNQARIDARSTIGHDPDAAFAWLRSLPEHPAVDDGRPVRDMAYLTSRIDQLTASHTALREERDGWQAATHTLLRATQVLRLEHTAMQADIRVLKAQLATARAGSASGLYPVPPAP